LELLTGRVRIVRNEFPHRNMDLVAIRTTPSVSSGVVGSMEHEALYEVVCFLQWDEAPFTEHPPMPRLEQFYCIGSVERLESSVKEDSLLGRLQSTRKRALSLSLNRRRVGFTPPPYETAGVSIRHHLRMLVMSTRAFVCARVCGDSSGAKVQSGNWKSPVCQMRKEIGTVSLENNLAGVIYGRG
jgi:hypothetical protein